MELQKYLNRELYWKVIVAVVDMLADNNVIGLDVRTYDENIKGKDLCLLELKSTGENHIEIRKEIITLCPAALIMESPGDRILGVYMGVLHKTIDSISQGSAVTEGIADNMELLVKTLEGAGPIENIDISLEEKNEINSIFDGLDIIDSDNIDNSRDSDTDWGFEDMLK
jgi:hypothetical protein